MIINKKELKEIFNGIAQNNEMKFNEFYSKYNKLIYSIAFSILKNEEESNDTVQIVFMKIWNMDKAKLPTKNELSWLYTLTKNETLNYLRNKKEEVSIDCLYEIEDENKDIDEIIDKDKYNRIVSNLNEKEREIVSLKIISGFSFKEIAGMLKLPIGTVKWRYYKAINTLKIIITNISMFIITIGLYIRNTIVYRKTNNADNISNKEENSLVEENMEIDTEIYREENKNEQNSDVAEESSKQESLDNNIYDGIEDVIEENVIEENITKENTIIEDRKEPVNVRNQNLVINNILLSLATIILIITIILSTFFIKRQLNRKKKTSK